MVNHNFYRIPEKIKPLSLVTMTQSNNSESTSEYRNEINIDWIEIFNLTTIILLEVKT